MHDDNKHAHEKLLADSDIPAMSSSLNISFVLHDVARLLGKRFEQRSRASDVQQRPLQTLSLIKSNLLEACAQPVVDREKAHG